MLTVHVCVADVTCCTQHLGAEALLKQLPDGFSFSANDPAKVPAEGTLLEREDATQSVKDRLAAVASGSPSAWESSHSRSELLVVHAATGGGKTAFLRTIAARHFVKDRDGNGAGVFVTYNETSDVYPVEKGEETRCFGAQLLLSCLDSRTAEIATRAKTLDDALAVVRRLMGVPGTTPLTICVDEISKLDKQKNEGYDPAQATISALKKYGDEQGASPVYFVFSSLIAAYEALADTTPGSQKPIKKIPLKSLTHEAAHSLLDDKGKDLVRRSPAHEMIFGALSGHPRAIVEGFIPLSGKATADDTDASITRMIDAIFERCKFAHYLSSDTSTPAWAALTEAVHSWFGGKAQTNIAKLHGWVQDEHTLLPLALRYYARKHASPLAKALKNVYDVDYGVRASHEKDVERLLYNFEIVQKLCLNGTTTGVPVKEFFVGGQTKGGVTEHFQQTRLYWVDTPDSVEEPTIRVASFRLDKFSEVVVPELLRGKTVIPSLQNEAGVDYLCPFFTRAPDTTSPYENKDLLVAKVQVKYVSPHALKQQRKSTPWGTITDINSVNASKGLEEAGAGGFTVLYTTYEGVPAQGEMSEDVVYYDRKGMESYTAKLGPLWFHNEKREAKSEKGAPRPERTATQGMRNCLEPVVSSLRHNASNPTYQGRSEVPRQGGHRLQRGRRNARRRPRGPRRNTPPLPATQTVFPRMDADGKRPVALEDGSFVLRHTSVPAASSERGRRHRTTAWSLLALKASFCALCFLMPRAVSAHHAQTLDVPPPPSPAAFLPPAPPPSLPCHTQTDTHGCCRSRGHCLCHADLRALGRAG